MARSAPLLRRFFAPAISRAHGFARDDRGVTIIEFGLLALPFFTLIFAIIETAMVFFASQVLDSAVEDASRMVRTGRAQSANYTMTEFRNYLCGYTFNLLDCSQIKLEIKVISNFSSASAPNSSVQTCSTTCTWTLTESYAPGLGRQVVQISAYYRWPLIVVLPYFNLKNQPDNYRMISATRVFRNEPF
jgi:Flp pilus assembly protein TadG